MSTVRLSPNLDAGRLAAIPVFAYIWIQSVIATTIFAATLSPVTASKVSMLTHMVLVTLFNTLLILLYFLRSSPLVTSRSMVTNTIAVMATFLPFLLAALRRPDNISRLQVEIANVIAITGLALAAYSISVLGRSFSIIPQARALVRRGPYRLVRHPLYMAEIIAMFGLLLAGPTLLRTIVFIVAASCQVYRATQEEQLLADTFPEYEEYASKTARFIPGVY